MKKTVFLASLLVVLLGLSASLAWAGVAAKGYDNAVAAARESLWRAITSGGAGSATVAVMDGGRIVYSEGFGVADRSSGLPVLSGTPFNIGSTSKMFAAVAVMLLVDEGKIDLDEAVSAYLPEFVMADERYRKITVRMLFNHSSGLPGSTFTFGYARGDDPQELLLDTLKESHLKHDPGALSIYCNDGFTLAERIVERISGKPFLVFLKERVFRPLAMTDTGPSLGERGDEGAVYYAPLSGKRYPPEWVPVYGAGGLSSTAEDLCRFGDSFTSGGAGILSEKSLEEMLRPQPTPFLERLERPQILHAFGWDYAGIPTFGKAGLQVVAKTGGTGCYSTDLVIVPAHRLVIAVSLSGRAEIEAVIRPVLEGLLKDKGLPLPSEAALQKFAGGEPIPAGFDDWAGFYVDEDGGVYRFAFDDERRSLDIFRLGPGSEEGPFLSLTHREGRFHAFKSGRVASHYFVSDGGTRYFVRSDVPLYGVDLVQFQKVDPPADPRRLGAEIDGRTWLIRNVSPQAQILEDFCVVTSSLYPELPGYVNFCGVLRVESADFASVAATAFRDQMELRLVREGDETRAKLSCFVFSPADGFPAVAAGENRLAVGPDGANQWMRMEEETVLDLSVPEGGRALVLVKGESPLYDSLVDDGEVYAPAGSYLFFAGSPGDVLEVRAR